MAAYALTFCEMKNEIFLECIEDFMPGVKPVYIIQQNSMRIPEVKEYVDKYGFLECCKDPGLAARVTLMPIKRFNLDCGVVFSHMLFLVEAMGVEIQLLPEEQFLITKQVTYENLHKLDFNGAIDKVEFVADVITHTRMRMDGDVPLLGYAPAPWMMFCYLFEGKISRSYPRARKFFYEHQSRSLELLDIFTEMIGQYCVMMGKAGVQSIQMNDYCAGCLAGQIYIDEVVPRLQRIRRRVRMSLGEGDFKLDCPMGIFAKGAFYGVNDFVKAGFEFIVLDWRIDISIVSQRLVHVLPRTVCLVGNYDPCALCVPSHTIKKLVHDMIKKFRLNKNIITFGTEKFPDHPLYIIAKWIEIVRKNTDSMTSILTGSDPAGRSRSSRSSYRRINSIDPYFYEKLAVIRDERISKMNE